ncbi:MAG: hypothetical protein JWM82_845 [Myxococcales bacterium]|nr:hypothetical protein [Myxococcales bacterium]
MRARETPLRGFADAKERFREIFPGGFADATYLAWERDYKWAAHVAWHRTLDRATWRRLLDDGHHAEVCARVVRFYARSKLNMLALYEWMALREALEDPRGTRVLAPAFYELIHGGGAFAARLAGFVEALDDVPQRQTRLDKWPVVTLFPFVAHPGRHLIVKPRLMKRAAERFGLNLAYESQPNARTYEAILHAAGRLRRALDPWRPRDLIDIQGFIWVTCSEEYETWPWS